MNCIKSVLNWVYYGFSQNKLFEIDLFVKQIIKIKSLAMHACILTT